MKTWINTLYILSFFSCVFFSCEKDEERITVQQGAAPTLAASANALLLERSKASENAITFSWNHLALTFSNPEVANTNSVVYTLFFNRKSYPADSARSTEIGNLLEKKYTVGALNTLLTKQFQMAPETLGEVNFWISAKLAPNTEPVTSEVLTIAVTPYIADQPALPALYMVGDATEGGWDNAKAPRMFNSEVNPNIFTYIGFLKAGSVKFLEKLGAWAPQYGSDGNGGVAYRPNEAADDPSSFTIVADGYYTITFDLPAKTVSMQPFSVTGKPTFTSIGLIGSFGNPQWDKIDPMTNTVFNPHIWKKQYTFSEDVEVKFRIAENWDSNWGATNKESENLLYGKGFKDSPNIKLLSGTYEVMFNDLTGNYIFISK